MNFSCFNQAPYVRGIVLSGGHLFSSAQICNLSVSGEKVASRGDFHKKRRALQRLDVPHQAVAQVSKPAVSPTSKSAAPWRLDGLRIWKSATQQTWKSALLWLRPCRAVVYRRIASFGTSIPRRARGGRVGKCRCARTFERSGNYKSS